MRTSATPERTSIVIDDAATAKLGAAWEPYSAAIWDKFGETGIAYDRNNIHLALREALIEQANTFRLGENYSKPMRDMRYDRANENVKHVLQRVFMALMAQGKTEEIVRGYLGEIIGKTMRTILEVFPDVERKELLAPRDSILPIMMAPPATERY